MHTAHRKTYVGNLCGLNRKSAAASRHWSVEEVLRRRTQLFTGPLLVQRYQSSARADMGATEIAKVVELAETYRTRLADLSWFMCVLNETAAREANKDDGVKGRFWEGRFKSL
jgi:hypothetical protein